MTFVTKPYMGLGAGAFGLLTVLTAVATYEHAGEDRSALRIAVVTEPDNANILADVCGLRNCSCVVKSAGNMHSHARQEISHI